MVKSFNVAVIDPNFVYRAGLKRIFGPSCFRVVFDAASLAEFRERVPEGADFDAILIGIEPGADTLEDDFGALREAYPETRIVLIAQSADEELAVWAAKAGCDGLVQEPTRAKTIIKSLELVLLGERVFPAQLLQSISNDGHGYVKQSLKSKSLGYNLSSREVEVLNSLCEGNANKVIARRLGITEATVKVHVKAILRKIRVKNRTEAALWARGFATEHTHEKRE